MAIATEDRSGHTNPDLIASSLKKICRNVLGKPTDTKVSWPALRDLARAASFDLDRYPFSTRFTASRRIVTPKSISSSVTVSGGAMRNTPPIPGRFTMFMERPSSIA
jgi:hypothetical protein